MLRGMQVRREGMRQSGSLAVFGRTGTPTRTGHSRSVRFVTEFSLLGALLALYLLLRYSMKGSVSDALDNAHHVVSVERSLGVFSEDSLQRLALNSRGVIRFLNGYYLFAHFTVTALFFAWLFIARPEGYARSRRTLIFMTAMALAIHAAYPLAPPRMIPDLGFVDTGHLYGLSPYGDAQEGLANQFAAMPSLHFGWALLVGWGALRFGRSKLRLLLIVHPLLTLAAIIITANHYWMDAAVALAIFATACSFDRMVRRRQTVTASRRGETALGDEEPAAVASGTSSAAVTTA